MSASHGRIVTFYSYKGGTGRSMALANVAWVLASTGARVLVVDWDLEAPGLHRYFRPFLSDKELVRHESEGVIDFMIDFAERMATPESREMRGDQRWLEKHADISKWSKQLLWPSGEDAQTRLGGTIHFVPAGRQGAAYAKRVNSFDWSGFYQKYSGGAFIDAVRRSMASFDWVLIDSRTGVSDTSGICTMQLPDTLVVCFTLNYQSIDGAVAVASSAKEGRKNELRVLPVPTRLDGSEDKLLRSMLAYARDLFDPLMESHVDRSEYWRGMGIPYFPRYAYSEKLAPFEEQVSDTTSTLPAVERLTSYITDGKVSKLESLPEPHRAEALAEFEGVPGAEIEVESSSPPVEVNRISLSLRRGWYWAQRNTAAPFAAAFGAYLVIGVIVYQIWFAPESASPQATVSPLIGDALKELEAGRRSQAALLIAEAAGRLDAASVVGPDGEPGRQIHQALMKLAPLLIETGQKDSVQISPDGQWLATTGANTQTSLVRFPPQGRQDFMPAGYGVAAFSPDSRYLASAGRNGTLMVTELATGRRVWQTDTDEASEWVTAASFSPNGNLLAAGTNSGAVVIAEVDPWKLVRNLKDVIGPAAAVDFVTFSPDSDDIVAAGRRSRAVFWGYMSKPREVRSIEAHAGGVGAIGFLPTVSASNEGAALVTASQDSVVRMWASKAYDSQKFPASGTLLAFARQGVLAIGGPMTDRVSLWTRDPEPMSVGTVSSAKAQSLAFSPDGLFLVSGNGSGEVVKWRWGTGSASVIRAAGAIASVAISENGKYVVFADVKGVYVMLPQPQESQDPKATVAGPETTFSAAQAKGFACSQTELTQLSAADWKKYFADEPLRFTCGATSTTASPELKGGAGF